MAAAVGGVASSETSSTWYRSLDKPVIQPPPVVFPIAWTLLYPDIALASAVVLDRSESRTARDFRWALGANLVLNASWSWVFFKAHRIGPAIAVAAALTASSLDLARRAFDADRRAGVALLPYAGWCGFASVLTAAIWRRNR